MNANNSWLGRQVIIQTGEPMNVKELSTLETEIEEIRSLLEEMTT